MQRLVLQPFVDRHPPHGEMKKADAATLERYRGLLPEALLELWREVGFGFYGGGLIQVIHPDTYRQILWKWLLLDEEDWSRLPIALTSFGEILYYRNLSFDDAEDVSWVNPHLSEIEVVAWSLDEFFNAWLGAEETVDSFLQPKRFARALESRGPLEPDEMYYFMPALRLGGNANTGAIERGDAAVQLEILYQLAVAE